MHWQWNLLAVPPLICGLTAIILTIHTHLTLKITGKKRTLTLLTLTAIWNLGYFLELISTDHALIKAMRNIQYIGIVFIPVVAMTYILAYTGFEVKVKKPLLAISFVIPIITLVLAFTNDSHHLVWASRAIIERGGIAFLIPTYGAGFWVFFVFSVLSSFRAIGLLIQSMLKAPSLYTRHNLVLIFAFILPLVIISLDLLNLANLPYYNLNAVSVVISIVLVRLSLKNFLAGDFNRASKELVFDSLDNALFVIDQDRTIMDLNQAAAGVVGRERSDLLGTGLHECLPELFGKILYNSDLAVHQRSLLEKDGRTYEVSMIPVANGASQVLGTVISLNDITAVVQQAADLNAILQTAQEVSSTLDLNQVLMRFGERALEISGCHSCLISEWDKANNCVNVLVDLSRATHARADGERYNLKDYPTTQEVLTTGNPARVAIQDSDPENTWMEELGIHQLLLLPLFHKDQVVGVVELGRTQAGSPFSDAEEEQVTGLIQEAAAWIPATHLEDQGEEILKLATTITQIADMDLCTISEWIPEESMIVSVAEIAYLSWDLGEGPRNDLAEWPSIAIAIERGEITHSYRSDLDPYQVEYIDLLKWGAKSRTVIPLTYQGIRIGIIELYNMLEEVQIEDSKLRLLGGIAEHASIAIQNARLHFETQMKLRQQTILKEASTVISSSLELQNVLDKLTEQLAKVTNASSSYIVTYDLDLGTSTVVAEYFGEGALPQERKSDLGFPYQADPEWFVRLEQGMEYVVSHHDDPEQWDSEKQHMHEFGVKSILYIPIRFMGNALGHAELWESRRKRNFNKDEISLCQAISQQAGSAIERAMLFEQSQFDATHDALTCLPNRTLLIDRLSQAIRRSTRKGDYKFALLYLDLDDFKLVNDSLGHLAGDEFLVEIANRLAGSTRQIDTVSRFGGDEFTILLEDVQDFNSVIQTVERIQSAISQPVNLQGMEIVITSSIGIVISSPEYANPTEYLRDVDIAMYLAKDRGKSRYEIFNYGSYLHEISSD